MVDKLIMTTLEKKQMDWQMKHECESCCSIQELYKCTYTYYKDSGQSYTKVYLCLDCYDEQLAEIKEDFGR